MIQKFYRLYNTEAGGKEFAGKIEAKEGRWHVNLSGGLRFYIPNFSGTLAECWDYCKREFRCEIQEAFREAPTSILYEPHSPILQQTDRRAL